MRPLLDTHSFIWLVTEPAKLSPYVAEILSDKAVEVFLSLASVWEMAIKVRSGKLSIALPVEEFVEQNRAIARITLLDIRASHIYQTGSLPLHHRDPFDRLLIAQAQVEGLTIVGCDPEFDHYDVARIWHRPALAVH
jgi:PIN domain nuclease of toxin-antitoxin system